MLNEYKFYLRNPDVVIINTARQCLLVDTSGAVTELDVGDPVRWSQLMQELMSPQRGDALRNSLEGDQGIGISDLTPLIEAGLLIESSEPSELETRRDRLLTNNQGFSLSPVEKKCDHLVVVITGSIVAGLMAPTILSLRYSGFQSQIDLILTEAALKFANRDLFEYYGIRTWVSPYDRRDGINVPHVALAQSADCILVMPASSSSCHRLANGTSSDLLSMTAAATTAPMAVAPVMNINMWNHKPLQRNVQQMKEDGIYVIEPSLIFGATELDHHSQLMYGGPGTFWRGSLGVMQTLTAVMEHHREKHAN